MNLFAKIISGYKGEFKTLTDFFSPSVSNQMLLIVILMITVTQLDESKEGDWHQKGDDDDELFLWYGSPTKGIQPYFQPEPLSEILTIANLRHVASRVCTCAEPEFRLSCMKLCSSDNHYTKVHPNFCFDCPSI